MKIAEITITKIQRAAAWMSPKSKAKIVVTVFQHLGVWVGQRVKNIDIANILG